MTEGSLPKPLLNAISLVCAAEVDCPRCINNHQTHLIEHFEMTVDDVMECIDFENSKSLDLMWKDVLRFARKVAFNEGTTEEDFQALRDHGIDDVGIDDVSPDLYISVTLVGALNDDLNARVVELNVSSAALS